jgi:hypothetical protein
MSHIEHKRRLHVLMWITVGLALLALVSGALGGCGGATPQVTPTPTRTPAPTATPFPTSTPLPTLTPAPAFTPTPTPLPENVNPLTGEVVADASVLNRVPVAIKISNWPPQYVRPQAGINSADIIYEHYNEGWFASRWTAIYLSKDPQRVGPTRSGRLIDLELPAIYKAVLACWGFSDGVAEIMRDSDLYPNRIASYSLAEEIAPDPFYRDTSRDVPLEHTGYTDPGRVRAWAEAHGISGRQDLQGMVFSAQPTVTGTPASYIYIPWRELDTEWRYDPASGRWLRWSDGAAHTDALNGLQLSAANVVILYVPQWDTDIVEDPHNGALSIQFALWDSNSAIIFRDGIRIDAYWQRWQRWDMLTLTDEQGNPIPLKVGNTFFEVLPADGDHWIEIVVE